MFKGKFITFEGMEGCGKSTQSCLLHQYLLSQNIQADLTREVGGTEAAEKMRDILVHEDLLPMSELLQIMAARFEHMHKKIIPKLKDGIWVICDRFIDSTACYQGQNKNIGVDLVYNLHKSLISSIMPDITFFINIKPDIALARALARGNNNKFENMSMEFHNKISQGFLDLSERFSDRIIRIDALSLSVEEIHNIIKAIIDKMMRGNI